MPAKVPETIDVAKRQRYIQCGVGLALFALFVVWLMRPNPQLTKVREMQREMFAKSPEKMTPEERKQRFEALRAEQEKLSEDERKIVRKEMGQQFQLKRNAEAVAYLKMTPAERLKIIDEKISRELAMQQRKGPAGGLGGGGPGGAPKGALAANPGRGPGGPGGPNVGAIGPGGVPVNANTAPPTAEDRDARRREMLIHIPPEARAGMDQMRLDMATRRAQKGLPPSTGRGPGGPR